ncbi:MAG TPA: oligosaccharide flippase family protein [Candidatus Sulfotelmatobacter sp.]|jgi:O-antigen/teichoic acid export membrane protein
MLKNIFSNWIAIVVVGAIAFLLTPFLIHHLGNVEFGLWVLVGSISGYSGLLEFGLRATLQRYVARYRGVNDRAALNQIFMTALALTLCIGVLIFVIMLPFAWVLPGFFGLSGERAHDFTLLIVLMAISIPVSLVMLLLGTYVCGWQRFDLYNLISVARSVMHALLIVVVLRHGYGVVALGVLSIVATAGLLPLDWLMVRHVDPELRLDWRLATPAKARELLEFSVWMFLNSTGIRLRTFTDSIVIGRVLNVALIAPFSVAGRLMQYFDPIINSMVSPMLPVMSGYEGQGRRRELRQFFLQATKITTLMTFLIGSILVLDSRLLLRVWVGEEFVSTYTLVLILLVGYVFELAQRPSTTALVALGCHRALGGWTLGEGLANLVLSIYWGHKYGLVGVALGTTVPLVIVKLTLQPWYTLRKLGVTARDYFGISLFRPVLVCLLFLAVCHWLMGSGPATGILGLGFTASWQGLLFGVITWMIGLSPVERTQARQRVSTIFATLGFAKAEEIDREAAEQANDLVNVG